MRPAELAALEPRGTGPAVAGDHQAIPAAQKRPRDLGGPRSGNREDGAELADRDPQAGLLAVFPPAGLIHVDRNGADRFPEFRDRSVQVGGALPFPLGKHPGRELQPEEVAGHLRDLAFAQAIGAGPEAEHGPQAGAEMAAGNPCGESSAGADPTSRTAQALELGFHDVRLNGWQFGHLVAERLGIVARKRSGTAATAFGLERDEFLNLVGRHQGAEVAAMLGLSSPLPPRGGRRRLAFDVEGLGGGGVGGVAGVLVETVLKLGDPSLKALEFGPEEVDQSPGFGQALRSKVRGGIETRRHRLTIRERSGDHKPEPVEAARLQW